MHLFSQLYPRIRVVLAVLFLLRFSCCTVIYAEERGGLVLHLYLEHDSSAAGGAGSRSSRFAASLSGISFPFLGFEFSPISAAGGASTEGDAIGQSGDPGFAGALLRKLGRGPLGPAEDSFVSGMEFCVFFSERGQRTGLPGDREVLVWHVRGGTFRGCRLPAAHPEPVGAAGLWGDGGSILRSRRRAPPGNGSSDGAVLALLSPGGNADRGSFIFIETGPVLFRQRGCGDDLLPSLLKEKEAERLV